MKRLEYILLISIFIIILECLGLVYFVINDFYILPFLFLLLLIITGYQFYKFVVNVNKKLYRFFDAIEYEDFNITFRNDNQKGQSFESLNIKMNEVIKSFSDIRAEREALLQFVQAIIQQLNVGVATFTTDGKIDLLNPAMLQILSSKNCKTIDDIIKAQPLIGNAALHQKPGQVSLVKDLNDDYVISVKDLVLRAKKVRLLVVHNIKTEMQKRELEAWQNLTKVLRHEIMNSVTPIVSLAQTMKEIVVYDLKDENQLPIKEDLTVAIETIIHRSEGIMRFVNAYREFTTIPTLDLQTSSISNVLKKVKNFIANKELILEIINDFSISIDVELIEQVLINLVKNAFESGQEVKVIIKAFVKNNKANIEVIDNGNGVPQEIVDQIFIPFYSTKIQGNGIGLSLSRQIMQMHNGTLHYEQNPSGKGSKFIMIFNPN
jgi:two-component system, NtrC family, nitrogen regulation sensor histidine kinase NtrY